MSDTRIPTMGLRFVQRVEPSPEHGPNVGKYVRVLQQRFTTPNGTPFWEDVPLVKEDD